MPRDVDATAQTPAPGMFKGKPRGEIPGKFPFPGKRAGNLQATGISRTGISRGYGNSRARYTHLMPQSNDHNFAPKYRIDTFENTL